MATAVLCGVEAWWDLRGPTFAPGPGAALTAASRARDFRRGDKKRSHDVKKPYPTVDKADAAAERYNQRVALAFGQMQSYPCRYCERFHIGHSENIGGRAFSTD